MASNIIPDNWVRRSDLRLQPDQIYPIPLTDFRVWDALATLLPGTAGTDDLGLIGGTFGSASPSLRTSDLKNTTGTQFARVLFTLPPEYQAGRDVTIRLKAGMATTVASSAATCDVQVFESNKASGVGSDLCTTAAQTCNSLTAADKDFVITSTGLAPGDVLDIRIALAVTDSATATAVIGTIHNVDVLLDIRG